MVSSEEIKRRLEAKKKGSNKGYLVCESCEGHYQLQEGESIFDFESCQCGGRIRYVENLDEFFKPPAPVVKEDHPEESIERQDKKLPEFKKEEMEKLFCPKCGTENKPGSSFCFRCGNRFDSGVMGKKRRPEL